MNVVAPESVGLSSDRLARIRTVMQSYVDRRIIAGAITLVARHGQVAHFECIGQMDVEANKPMQADAIFRIYSMTKPITSIALMMLVEQGRLLLSDPVSKYVPEFKDMRVYAGRDASGAVVTSPVARPITVHDLFTHTAGLGYGLFTDHPVEDLFRAAKIFAPLGGMVVPLDEMARRIASIPLANQPGARWRYSMATDMLGYLVQVIAGQPFDVYLAEKIFQPLGMSDTGFHVPAEKVGRFTACYMPNPTGGLLLADAPAASPYRSPARVPSGGGGLVSTAADYLRFAQMLLNGGELDGARMISRKTLAVMTANHLPPTLLPLQLGPERLPGDGFGLGFSMRIGDESGTLGSTGMYGWGGAAATRFHVDPLEDMISIFMPQLLAAVEPIRPMFQNTVYQAIID
ncbi:MAG: beta-lactamase family protein [Chloroflexi bacterium]|nr:beta-lactamase family protein [Chloroflexota bacterium]